jgi:hypothetical protein
MCDIGTAMQRAVPAARTLPDSPERFDTGGEYRIEIPSVEGPEAFEAVLSAAAEYGVGVHRISQGSGIAQLLDDEIRRYVKLGAEHQVEVCPFVGPRAPGTARPRRWSGTAASSAGGGCAAPQSAWSTWPASAPRPRPHRPARPGAGSRARHRSSAGRVTLNMAWWRIPAASSR